MARAARLQQLVLTELRSQSLFADREAIKLLTSLCQADGSIDPVHKLLQQLDFNSIGDGKLTKAAIEDQLENSASTSSDEHLIQVIDARTVPRICYDPIRKTFYLDPSPAQLHADAKAKIQLYHQRLLIVKQRLMRMAHFSRPALGSTSRTCIELTDIKALQGNIGETKFVLGFLSQLAEGQYGLEDLSGSVVVDLRETTRTAGLFTENCVVVAEGVFNTEGVFQVVALGFPPLEPRADSIAMLKGLDWFGGHTPRDTLLQRAQEHEATNPEARIVVLSDVWLDKPATLGRLEMILDGFAAADPHPSMLILCGNFQSYNTGTSDLSMNSIADNFGLLATLLGRYEYIKHHTRVVLVPGPWDVGYAGVLPQAPLLVPLVTALRDKVPNIVFASNPCRIRWCTQEIVVFRYDLQLEMLRQHILGGGHEDASTPESMFQALSATLLQQSHLCPLPMYSQPIRWQLDPSLRLYPLPHCVVLADSQPQQQCVFASTLCINPGSLQDESFAAYVPSQHTAELIDLKGGEEDVM